MVTSPLIRTLVPDDAPQLTELVNGYRAALSESPTPSVMLEAVALDMIANATGDQIILLGAEAHGRLAGFAHAFDLPEIISGSPAGKLDDLFVSPNARGQAWPGRRSPGSPKLVPTESGHSCAG